MHEILGLCFTQTAGSVQDESHLYVPADAVIHRLVALFFHAWEYPRGRHPAILEDSKIGKHARELFDDAQNLDRIVAKSTRRARCSRFGRQTSRR